MIKTHQKLSATLYLLEPSMAAAQGALSLTPSYKNYHPPKGTSCLGQKQPPNSTHKFHPKTRGQRPTGQVGLGAVGVLSRAPNANKNLLFRPLVVTTHLPIDISHRAPPVHVLNPNPIAGDGARSSGLYSRLGTYLMRSLGTRVPNGNAKGGVNGNTTRMLSDRVLFDDCCNSPRKKAKRSEEDHGSSEGSTFVVIDNSGFDLISYPTSAFLSYCFTCDKKLKHNEDIYILRGEMAFCSDKCREREIFNQEKKERVAEASSSVSRVITRNRSLRELSPPEGYDGLPC